ncbi:hypothetical protein, partial [Pseudomonas syringae group genomosp. 7]|uniref:hypothetical protein n=1 Tax=Pseudomonas syringae group genomosp. 7 TaxID=251699 RepID=UPI00376F5336
GHRWFASRLFVTSVLERRMLAALGFIGGVCGIAPVMNLSMSGQGNSTVIGNVKRLLRIRRYRLSTLQSLDQV